MQAYHNLGIHKGMYLVMAKDALEEDFLQEAEGGDAAHSLVFVQVGKHPASLWPCSCQNTAGDCC